MNNRDFVLKIGGKVDNSLIKSFGFSSKELKKLSKDIKSLEGDKSSFDSIKKATTEFNTGIKYSEKELKLLHKEIKSTSEGMNLFDDALNTSSKETIKLSEELKLLKKEERNLKSLKDEGSKLEKQFQEGRKEYKVQQQELWKTSEKVKKLNEEIRRSKKPTKSLIREFKKAKKVEDKLKESTDAQRKSLTNQMKQIKKTKQETSKLISIQDSLTRKQKEYGKAQEESSLKAIKAQEKLVSSMKKVQKEQERIKRYEGLKSSVSEKSGDVFKRSLAQGAVIGVGVKFAIDEEESFSDVRKVLNFESKADAELFKKQLKQETKDIPLMINQIYDIASAAGQAGINKLEIPDFTADTSMVSVAFDTNAKETGKMLATWRKSFKMTQKEVMTLANQMNLLGDSINVTPGEVAQITTTVGSLGKMANFTQGKTAALGGTLMALGVKDASTASTAMRKLFGTLTSGEAASKSVSEAFNKLGLDSIQVAKDMQNDSEGTLVKVFTKLKGLDKTEQLSITKQLFGEEAMASMGLLINNTEFLKENFKLVGDSMKYSGSVLTEYNNKLDTTKTDLMLLGKSLAGTGATLTKVLLPPLRSGADLLKDFSDGIASFTEEFPDFSKTLMYGVTGFVGFKLGLSGTVLGIKQLSKAKDDLVFLKDTGKLVKEWKQWGPALSHTKQGMKTLGVVGKTGFKAMQSGVIALGTSMKVMLFNPWVLGIGAVLAGGYLIYKNWDKIKEGWQSFKSSFVQGSQELKEGFLAGWESIKVGFTGTYEYIASKLETLWKLWQKFTIPGRAFKWTKEKYEGWKNQVPKYGKGGVVNKPHLAIVGDSEESIIPHNGSKRSEGLWFDTGRRMGMFAGSGIPHLADRVKSKTSNIYLKPNITINAPFNPTINGVSDVKNEDLSELLNKYKGNLEDTIRKVLNDLGRDKERMSFE